MAIDGIIEKVKLNNEIKDDLNKIFPDDKKLNETDLQDEVLLAEIYCFIYLIDQAAFSDFIERCSLIEIKERIKSNFNEKFDSHYDVEKLKRRFNDPERNKYLVSDLGPNSLLTNALNVIRGKDEQMASKIKEKLEYIRSWQKNNILDKILEYNRLDYLGDRGDIDAKIAQMRSCGSSVNKSDNEALLALGLDLSRELQGKFKIIRDDSLPPAAAGAAGVRVSPSWSSSPPVAAGAAGGRVSSSGQGPSAAASGAAGANSGQGLPAELIPPKLIGAFGGNSVVNGNGAFSGAAGANSGQGPSPVAAGAAGANSGQGLSAVAAGAAGGRVSPLVVQQNDEAIAAIRKIAFCLDLLVLKDGEEIFQEFRDIILQILESLETDSLQISAENRKDYENALDVLKNKQDDISKFIVELLEANVPDKDAQFEAAAAGGRVSPSGKGLSGELRPPELTGPFGGGSVPNSPPNAAVAAAGANSGQGPSPVAAGAAGGRVSPSGKGLSGELRPPELTGPFGGGSVPNSPPNAAVAAAGANSGQGPSPVAAGAAGGSVSPSRPSPSAAAASSSGANSGQGPSNEGDPVKFGGGSVPENLVGFRSAGAASKDTGPVTSSRAPLFGAQQASSSPKSKILSTDKIKENIRGYVSELLQLVDTGDGNFRDRLIKFLNEAEGNIDLDLDPQLSKRLDLFFQSVNEIGGCIVLAHAAESKNINSKHVLEKGGKKVNLGVDCIESRLMHEAGSNSFNYIIGAKTIGGLQKEVKGNYVLVDPNDGSANESYAPYAVPDDESFLRDGDTQKSLCKLNLLDGISKMAGAIIDNKTDIRVACVEGKGRSVTLAWLFAKICKGDFTLDHNDKSRDEELIKMLARDRNSDYNYVTTGSQRSCDYNQSVKFQMLRELLGEFRERLAARTGHSEFFQKVQTVADSIKRSIKCEESVASQYRNQSQNMGIGA